jgi:hypothetical protein
MGNAKTELELAAIAYADSQRETAQTCGWHEEKCDDFMAGAAWQAKQGKAKVTKENTIQEELKLSDYWKPKVI